MLYKHQNHGLIAVSQSGYSVGLMTEEYWFVSRKFDIHFSSASVLTRSGGRIRPSKS